MRIALVVHGFPPLECAGVETHCAALARVIARAGHAVEVFAPRRGADLPHLAVRREERDGFGLTWIHLAPPSRDPGEQVAPAGVAERFGEFLDRERCELVHFHHLQKLGFALIEEARRRGLPTVWTAHDLYAICHRATHLRPDLSTCDVVGDPEACARCDRALAFLDVLDGLGDYQVGVLPDQLDGEQRGRLEDILQESGGGAADERHGPDPLERRRAADRARAEQLAGLDCIFAPTRFVAERLVEGGLDAARVELRPYAIEGDALRALERPRRRAGEPLRFGYVGSIAKHKGVHVLVEAFARLGPGATLSIHGDSSDRSYVERVRAAAEEAGAEFAGPFDARDLPAVLDRVDVLVVPSVWPENQPFVIREAFAAGRPVLASDAGALAESVRDGVDGLLFPAGDADALAAAMQRAMEEPELFDAWVRNLPEVPELGEEAAALTEIYEGLLTESRACRQRELPEHLRPFADRREALEALPARELLKRVLSGLGALRRRLGAGAGPSFEELLGRALSRGSRVQEQVRDGRGERDWLAGRVDDEQRAARALGERARWLEGRLADREAALEHEKERGQDREHAQETLERERDWLRGVLLDKDRELEWMQKTLRARADALERALEERRSLEQERNWQRTTIDELRGERDWQRENLSELHRERDWLRETLEGVERERDWLGERAEELGRESAWRGEQMDLAVEEGQRVLRSLLRRSDLARRLADWPRADAGAPGEAPPGGGGTP